MDPNLQIQNLSFGYPGKKIFDSLTFAAEKGHSLVILGASGSGKTTLLKLAAGIIFPVSGQVLINGINLSQAAWSQAQTVYRELGFLFQDTALIANMNISDNLALPLRYHGRGSPDEIALRVLEFLRQFGLENYAESLPAQISVGLKKRAALARALINQPRLLFLDDPLAEADLRFQEMIIQIARAQKSQGTLSLTTTSNFSDAVRLADHVILIQQGKIIKTGSPAEVETAALQALKEGQI
ncbi:MAG: ATP-binding cassette domain-containing protein [Proteobacteria bacterium]|nr:ATP-binding cassette domain-containing protein [Pseudomonadota bacterium]